MQKIVSHILAQAGNVELINITGGEPTLHPALFELIATCKHEKIGRITMNTNGLRIADDQGFAEKLKAAGIQLVFSLDTLDPVKSQIIHGQDVTDNEASPGGEHPFRRKENPRVVTLGLAAFEIGGDPIVPGGGDEIDGRQEIVFVKVDGQSPYAITNEQIHPVWLLALQVVQEDLLGDGSLDLPDTTSPQIVRPVDVQ